MIKIAEIADLQNIESFDPFSGNRKEDVEEGRVYVYILSGHAIGFISMARSGLLGRSYVQYLAVSPEYRGNNIASKLLGHVEKTFASERLFISTESNNKLMQALLKKRSYIEAGEISGANKNGTRELYYYKDQDT